MRHGWVREGAQRIEARREEESTRLKASPKAQSERAKLSDGARRVAVATTNADGREMRPADGQQDCHILSRWQTPERSLVARAWSCDQTLSAQRRGSTLA